MAIQSRIASPAFDQKRVDANNIVRVRPKAITIVLRLILIMASCLTLTVLASLVLAGTEAVPTTVELLPQILPGNVAPTGLRCRDTGNETCFPPVDAQCYESGDDDCFISAVIQQNGKAITVTIDLASRRIVQTDGYAMGDLLMAWGTPTGFSQSGRDIDVYWGTRKAHLTTCSFRAESLVELVADNPKLDAASPWRGFVRIESKECKAVTA